MQKKYILILSFCITTFFLTCQKKGRNAKINNFKKEQSYDYSINTSKIPKDTIFLSDKDVALKNGIYYKNNQKFSGIVVKILSKVKITTFSSVLEGKLHGTYRSFFENEKPYEVRNYKNNLATGRHYYYWKKTGNLKFDCTYYENKKEGLKKRWYIDGKPYIFLNYKNDKLDGLQQAWRKNGKLYINFEAINGKNYGLQRTAPCYNLIDEEVQMEQGFIKK